MSALSQEAKAEVTRLLRAGQKIHAIKYLHDTFNVSLAEAKLLTEAVEKENTGDTTSSPASIQEMERHVQELLAQGKKIEAVKYVHQQYDTGLKEALSFVEGIESKNPSNTSSFQRSRTQRRPAFLWVFAGVAFLLLSVCIVLYVVQQNVVSQGHRVEGLVVGFQTKSGGGRAPVVAYQWLGKSYEYASNTYTSPPAYDLNEEVMLFVNQTDPNDVVIDSFSERWLAIVIVGGLGTLFAFFFILFYFLLRRF